MNQTITVQLDVTKLLADAAEKIAPTIAAIGPLIDALNALPPDLLRILARELSERLAEMAEG